MAFDWAGPRRLIWEGHLDVSRILKDQSVTTKDLVMRLDVYVGERDLFGLGFSDNVIFRAQHYVRVLLQAPYTFFHYPDERFARPGHQPTPGDVMTPRDGGWEFDVSGPGFQATFRVELDTVPEVGDPWPFGMEPAGATGEAIRRSTVTISGAGFAVGGAPAENGLSPPGGQAAGHSSRRNTRS